MPIARQQPVAGGVGLDAGQLDAALEQVHGLGDQAVEVGTGLGAVREPLGIGMAGQAHREAVIGLHRDAAGIVADQVREPAAQFQRRGAVEAEHQDAMRRYPQHPQQVGAAMHDDAGLAGAGAGQHQPVAVLRGGDDLGLSRVAEGVDDGVEGLGGGGAGQHLAAVGEEALDERRLAQREVGGDQPEGLADLLRAQPGVLIHDVDLKHPLAIVLGQGLVLRLAVASALGLRQQLHRHRRAEHRKAAVQDDGAVLVQEHQPALHGRQRVAHLGR